MVERVYSHPGQVRHRSEVVKHRIEQHSEQLADHGAHRMARFGTTVPESEALR